MNKYIEHIIKDMVRDTKLDFEELRITYPFTNYYSHHTIYSPLPDRNLYYSFKKPPYYEQFSDYCKENYGLTKEEIDYVWGQYKSIIIDKITNNE